MFTRALVHSFAAAYTRFLFLTKKVEKEMAAAFAALVSLLNTIILELTPRDYLPFHISYEGGLLESLRERVQFLVEFLEQEWRGTQNLEDRIVEAAYAAEDAIDSYIAGQLLGESSSQNEEESARLSQDLGKIIGDMDSFKIEAMQIKERGGDKDLRPRSTISAAVSCSDAPQYHQKDKMVGFDDMKAQLMELIAADQSKLQVIAIVGMAGMGKSMLARNVYDDNYMVNHFEVRVWITIRQEYNLRDILEQLSVNTDYRERRIAKDIAAKMSERNLGGWVHQNLFARKYLIICDDIWSLDAWNAIKRFVPDNDNQSRVVLTTRFSNVANECSTSRITMNFLDEDGSWNLLCQKAFAQRNCPIELVEIGKRIAKNCRGLPLSITTIGGLLAKSELTRNYWEHVAEDVQSTMDLDIEQHCLKILRSSYDHLPVHLRPCLLYMGLFPEDNEIRFSELSRLWVAEGILKPIEDKSSDEIAQEYFNDLLERNLILVRQWGLSGKLKLFYIHDLVRYLCLREAQRSKFFYDTRCSINEPHGMMSGQRRFSINRWTSREGKDNEIHRLVGSAPIIRSLTCNEVQVLPLKSPRVLRVLSEREVYTFPFKHYERGDYTHRVLSDFINSRYVASNAPLRFNTKNTLPWLLRNLQTLVAREHEEVMAPSEIWNMQQLRHVKFRMIHLPKPPRVDIVLENLQMLTDLADFQFDEDVVKRILNIRKLRISCTNSMNNYGLKYLGHLQKLESLHCSFIYGNRNHSHGNLILPHSLRKLTLMGVQMYWKDMTIIGSLPHLEVLRLHLWSFVGQEWNPIEGEFQCLKYLSIQSLRELEIWNADGMHFPRLEQLVLGRLPMLREIPLDIGNIPRLRLLQLAYSTDSAIISAWTIWDEQDSFGNDQLKVEVKLDTQQSQKFLGLFSLSGKFIDVKRINIEDQKRS